jgi:hypothetical protein
MKLTSKTLAGLIFLTLFGGIALSNAAGWWQTESSKLPATFTDGEFAGQPNPADIRGSYTFSDISQSFAVPVDTLAQAFGVPAETDAATFAIKDLENLYADQQFEIGTASVRLFVAFYAGLPYDLLADTYLPATAVVILKTRGTLSQEQLSYVEAHSLNLGSTPPVTTAPTAEIYTDITTERIIKGKTSFQELLEWGASPESIEQVIGERLPNPLTKIKDYCTEKGLDFEEIKTALQTEVDKLQP